MGKEVKMLSILGLALLGLLITIGTVFIVGSQWLKVQCEEIDEDVYSGGLCYTDANVNVTSGTQAFNQTKKILDAVELVVAFAVIVVLVAIAKILLDIAKGFRND